MSTKAPKCLSIVGDIQNYTSCNANCVSARVPNTFPDSTNTTSFMDKSLARVCSVPSVASRRLGVIALLIVTLVLVNYGTNWPKQSILSRVRVTMKKGGSYYHGEISKTDVSHVSRVPRSGYISSRITWDRYSKQGSLTLT